MTMIHFQSIKLSIHRIQDLFAVALKALHAEHDRNLRKEGSLCSQFDKPF